MNTIHLNPADLLFFRDGRPMSGAASGHGSAWPLPHVINAAFHAALHRAELENVHGHRAGRSSDRDDARARDQKFGSLRTVGPFPVDKDGLWYFPRPADAQDPHCAEPTLRPLASDEQPSSLPSGLRPVVNTRAPGKDKPATWWSAKAWHSYLEGKSIPLPESEFPDDSAFADTEYQIGIGIDRDTGTVQEGAFYSAQYLRLRPSTRLGVLAEAPDKINGTPGKTRDLIRHLLDEEQHLVVGGQQRVCSAELIPDAPLPLPVAPPLQGRRVKWTLLTPALFPRIEQHPGGWLPNWIDPGDWRVQLLDGPGKNKAKRMGKDVRPGQPIQARLIAALVSGSQPVTGFATGGNGETGAKSPHLAVPAGSVYYFEADSEEQAGKLADALNWHGAERSNPTLLNRRSTLFGEKGFGLGLCSPWEPR